MSVSLGGIVLDDNLVLDGIDSAPVVMYQARKTLGGRTFVRTMTGGVNTGRVLSLTGELAFSAADLDAIRALAALGAQTTLVHHRGTFDVYITGITADPEWQYADPDGDTDYSATITLQEL